MSYARIFGATREHPRRAVPQSYRGFGATNATAADCVSGAQYNAADKDCYCPPGMDSPDTFSKPCAPVSAAAPCTRPGQIRNPVDKQCACPPGTIVNPDPRMSDCVPGYWFPDCLDAQGNRVPSCVYGMPMMRVLPVAAAALATGVALALLFKAVR